MSIGSPPKQNDSAVDKFDKWQGPTKVHFSIAIALLVIVALIAVVVVRRSASTANQIRPSGIPGNISTPVASLMELSPAPNVIAPGFTLTDQNGKTISLLSLRGKSVVLEFMDPNCTDICPIVSQEFVDAYHNLGSSAKNVAFVAINVNKYHLSTSDVAKFTNEHGLNAISNWHFFTGPLTTLSSVWNAYGISVVAPSPTADVQHSSEIFFIGPHGHERYIASPIVNHTKAGTAFLPANQLSTWGKGISSVSKDTL